MRFDIFKHNSELRIMLTSRKKVLITVATYPLPSRSYDELVCTAGILEDGTWIRIYPVPLSFIKGLREGGQTETYKYNWIELDLRKRTDDFRPESHSPLNPDFRDIQIHGKIGTGDAWRMRKEFCLKEVFYTLSDLINLSKKPIFKSLAVFKPAQLLEFIIEDDDREWKKEWQDQLKQLQLFDSQPASDQQKRLIKKLPFKFYYRFKDSSGRSSRMMIEDWEIGALYWNCLKSCDGDEVAALEKVKLKYWIEFQNLDIYLFLGTTKEWHARNAPNPFVIIGVFYPPQLSQLTLF